MILRRSALLLLALVLFSGSAHTGAAQTGSTPAFNPANGHWYQLVRAPGQLNWPGARDAAQAMYFAGYRGHLATVTSAEENRFVSTYLSSVGGASDLWLGAIQDRSAPDYSEPTGGWRWVTGEPWKYTSWSGTQPDNAGGTEDALETNSGGIWNDLPPGAGLTVYLVEYEPPATPGAPVLSILPNPVIGGQTTVGQVTLDRPAPPGDLFVLLTSSQPSAAVLPAVVIVPAGATTALFSIITFPAAAPLTVTLTATGPGGTRSAPLQVLPFGTSFPAGSLLVNGSFEEPHVQPGQPSTQLPGWRVTRGSIDVVPAASWQPAPDGGSQSLDLVGDSAQPQPSAGAIEQTVPTVAGRDYLLSGWMAHNPGNPVAPEGRANVTLNGQFFVQLFHRDALATPTAMHWVHFAYRFRAAGPTTTLAIADVTGTWDKGGLALDGLSLTLVPQNLLVNGSFEEPDLSAVASGGRALGLGDLPGWQIVQGPADLVDQRAWQPAPGQGNQTLHLASSQGAAAIEQTFPTEPGRLYLLSGWLSRSYELDAARLSIFLNGELLADLLHTGTLFGPQSRAEMRWQPFLTYFRAAGPTTTLRLADASGRGSAGAAALDGLIVAPADAPAPGQAPAAPTGLQVRLISPTQVDLIWADNSSDETGFEIQRRSGSGDWTRIALVGANVTRFSDFGVSPNTTYSYRVQAQNDSGPSAWSNEAGVTTLPQ